MVNKTISKYKFFSIFTFIVLVFFSTQNLKAQSNFNDIAVGFIYVPKLYSQNKLEDYELGGSGIDNLGVSLMIDTTSLMNFGFSYYAMQFNDLIDKKLSFSSKFLFVDIFFRLPTPRLLDIYLGTGLGYNYFSCIGSTCSTVYRDIKIDKEGSSVPIHFFVRSAFWIGKIYRFVIAYQQFNNPKIILNDKIFIKERLIEHKIYGFGLGLEILF